MGSLRDIDLYEDFPLKTGETTLYVGEFVSEHYNERREYPAHYPEEVFLYPDRCRAVEMRLPGRDKPIFMFWKSRPATAEYCNEKALQILAEAVEVKSYLQRGHRKSAVRGWAFYGFPNTAHAVQVPASEEVRKLLDQYGPQTASDIYRRSREGEISYTVYFTDPKKAVEFKLMFG